MQMVKRYNQYDQYMVYLSPEFGCVTDIIARSPSIRKDTFFNSSIGTSLELINADPLQNSGGAGKVTDIFKMPVGVPIVLEISLRPFSVKARALYVRWRWKSWPVSSGCGKSIA